MQSNEGLPELDVFLQFLFEGLEGYVYLAAKEVNDKYETLNWLQEFFQYPAEESKLKKTIRTASKTHEIYIAPVMYNSPSANGKEAVKASNVVWTEFDGNAPEWNEVNAPSLIVQSSSEKNQHVYWRLNHPIEDVAYLENINRRITYNLGADSSAWDSTQVLRPPESWNHKRNTPVNIFTGTDHVYDSQIFIDSYDEPPPLLDVEWEQTDLPTAESVLLKYALTPDIIKLISTKKEEVTDRSSSLMNLAYACAQLNMTSTEIMTILVMMDNVWEKFKDRKDRFKRLGHIITIAKNKHPGTPDIFEETFAIAFGWETFLNTEVNIDWLIEGLLMEQGNMLLVGPSGLGKTQFTLQTFIHLALGKDFLHYKITEPKKVMFLSLEMGLGELKIFAEAMSGPLNEDELALLEENFIILPHGEPWPLNKPEGQAQLIQFIENHKPTMIGVDSIGSAISGNISSDEAVQPYTEFVDRVRNKYSLAWWSIHHMRKAQDRAITQDDVYGNQYLLNRSTSTYALLRGKNGLIKVRNFKMRMAQQEQDYFIKRVDHLNFAQITEGIDELVSHNIDHLNGGQPLSDETKDFKL